MNTIHRDERDVEGPRRRGSGSPLHRATRTRNVCRDRHRSLPLSSPLSPEKAIALVGAALTAAGYMLMRAAAASGEGDDDAFVGSYGAVSAWGFVLGFGGAWTNIAALVTASTNFAPEDRGLIVGIVQASARFFVCLCFFFIRLFVCLFVCPSFACGEGALRGASHRSPRRAAVRLSFARRHPCSVAGDDAGPCHNRNDRERARGGEDPSLLYVVRLLVRALVCVRVCVCGVRCAR